MKVNTKTILNYDIPDSEKLNKKVLSEKECEEVRYLFHERGYNSCFDIPLLQFVNRILLLSLMSSSLF